MTPISITLQPSSREFKSLEKEILSFLTSLETVEYRTETRSAEGGSRGTEQEILRFVVENSGRVAELAAAIMVIVSQVKASSEKPGRKAPAQPDNKSVIVEIGDRRIDLPASQATRREFLKLVEQDLGGHRDSHSERKVAQK